MFFNRKSEFWSKIEILIKIEFVKIEILVKNRNVDKKSKFWFKIEMLIQNQNVEQTRNFGQKSKYSQEI